ncbi:hypothetical protein [Helicobacter labetoulli]|uniref:hypothetical protein n=1 Tax=Helicobacter labetoulli TaxID=2315333 RepID=UPI000EF6A7B7|nr:hypothetical protein [Helicobacter labetoulli]
MGDEKAVRQMWGECKKKSKMAKQGAKTIQMWVRIQKIKTKNQCKKASQNVWSGANHKRRQTLPILL